MLSAVRSIFRVSWKEKTPDSLHIPQLTDSIEGKNYFTLIFFMVLDKQGQLFEAVCLTSPLIKFY
jgi:hypothetical protein